MLLVVCQLSRDVIGYEDSLSTDVIQLTLTLKMTTAQVVETSVTVNNNSPIQDYVHPDDQTQPTFEMTPGFKPFTIKSLFTQKFTRRKVDNIFEITSYSLHPNCS